ncbi:MAG TPA: type II secretion system secretin GspD [Casimicrobiaceae bacterium]|nr:type II secretion system secretin GspD [Casimicrobiaceae bacterium]
MTARAVLRKSPRSQRALRNEPTIDVARRRIPRALGVALVPLIVSCAQQPVSEVSAPARTASSASKEGPVSLTNENETERSRVYKGSGILLRGEQAGGELPPGPPPPASRGGPVVLNFEGADLREVVRNILGDILNESYTIDPNVGGQVTIRTTTGISREALPATLETILRMNGATMVREGTLWKILPQTAAERGNVTPQLGNFTRALPAGYSVQIVPLRYIGAAEMLKILEPFAKDAQAVRADITRNLLILSGTETELRHLRETIDTFDIDWMAGMSAGVFTLQNADVKSVSAELDKIIGDKNTSPLTGILKIIPIERMNALLVISPNPEYIDQAKKWIERLDSGSGEGVRFYVYNLKNQRAEHIGPLLQQAFTGQVTQTFPTPAPTVAPGTPAGSIISAPNFQAQPVIQPNTPAAAAARNPVATGAAAGGAAGAVVGSLAARGRTGVGGVGGAEGGGVVRNIQVVADKDQNTILIVATPSEYSIIEQALRKLDVPSRQVVIEVTIAEVKLNDTTNFGIDWAFKGGAPSGRGSGGLFISNKPFNPAIPTSAAGAAASGLAAAAQGFSYIINNANFPGGVQAVLNLLDTYGNTKVIANPHIAALDNQKATIKAGNRIPINQQTVVGDTTNAITTTSQYIDTGVLLQVTPHINAGGLVTLDVQAEVSSPGQPDVLGGAPPIDTRSLQTLVSVPSGQTMVMGGLIQETKANSNKGFPIVNRLPVLGALFGSETLQNDRSELVLFITPHTVNDTEDIQQTIEDLRRRMETLDRVFPGTPNWPASPPSYSDRFQDLINPYRWELPKPSVPKPSPPPAGQPTQTPLSAPEPVEKSHPAPGASQKPDAEPQNPGSPAPK